MVPAVNTTIAHTPKHKQGPTAIECGVLVSRVTCTDRPRDALSDASSPSTTTRRVRTELAACATSPTFGVAYQAAGMQQPEAHIIRQVVAAAGSGEAGGEVGGEGSGTGHGKRQEAAAARVVSLEFCCSWSVDLK